MSALLSTAISQSEFYRGSLGLARNLEAPPNASGLAFRAGTPNAHSYRQRYESAAGRYCCKSLFALVIKNSPGCRVGGRRSAVGGRRSDRLMAGKLSLGNFGLLQQYRHSATFRCNSSI